MARKKNRMSTEVNAGSMADIAFLLLIFFLVTTTIASDKGILNILPPKLDPNNPPPEIDLNARNIFNILINANDQLLVEDEFRDNSEGLDEDVKAFILNFGAPNEEATALYNGLPSSLKALAKRDPESSDHPGEAVVSIKTNRGTSYEKYLEVFDLAKKAYFDIYAERVNLTTDEYRALSGKDDAEVSLQDRGKEGIPMAISIAEPDKIGS
ncbi:biopolymer transporter ExbD [Algoriphagus halophytocola]|uniref:Biopolymer transporter ExbD n=1 Tax=Algoriphagus halophytocola TaxID=2991499 RepID=A0ABY6MMS6_9BACT|nr:MULTISPECIES: biopolymer transporter ExbD [unclassified Algoriphagus]UZD24463.1 biopolymer transporter ExbD [Algoriphagus sp. TR-M5]WBL41827.1 biopolymer transporter ExbD [Algoriphagus sp. TR-M9]